MNRPIRLLSIGCLLLFLGLLVNANYLQFVAAGDLNDRPENRRVLDEEYSRERGPILVGDEPVAESVPSDDEYVYQRTYEQPLLYAHLTGYYAFSGRTGIESSQNSILSGSDNRLFVNRVVDLVGDRETEGGSVSLTLDRAVQEAAFAGLADLDEGFRGGAVALDPDTGAVLALANRPTFDPNELASHDFDAAAEAYEDLDPEEPDSPLLSQSTQVIAPPGSTFKLVTAAAAIENLDLAPDSLVNGGETYEVNGYTMPNDPGVDCGTGNNVEITLQRALEQSCNVSFGSLAVEVGEDAMADQAAKFGFGDQDYLRDLSTAVSSFSDPEGASLTDNEDLLAKAGIGQQDVAATPLQMAMVVAGIANDGDVMDPYVVDEVRSPDLDLLDSTEPEPIDDQPAISSTTAAALKQMMVATVEQGTASAVQSSDYQAGGKTGTAQRGEGQRPYSWFVAFAPAEDPEIAVAVMAEPPDGYGGEVSGGGIAGVIANDMLQAALGGGD